MKSKTIPIIISALVVAAGLYWYFFTGTGNEPSLTVTTSENSSQTKFKLLISELPTSFNTAIFSDPRFNALVDLTTQISPESSGRPDPFAPVAGVGGK